MERAWSRGTATLAVGLVALSGAWGLASSDQDRVLVPLTSDVAGSPEEIHLDVEPLQHDTAATLCGPDGFGDAQVLFAQRQVSPIGPAPAILVENDRGDWWACDRYGGSAPATLPVPLATSNDAAVPFTTGWRSWDCEGTVLHRLQIGEWFSTAPEVATLRTRFVVDGAPGPWFSTSAYDGFAHLQAWLEGDLPAGTRIVLEHGFSDADGLEVETGMSQSGEPLPDCSDGHDFQLS
jgi:hypothetical protein